MRFRITTVLEPFFSVRAGYHFGFYGDERQTSFSNGRVRGFKWFFKLIYCAVIVDKRRLVEFFLIAK